MKIDKGENNLPVESMDKIKVMFCKCMDLLTNSIFNNNNNNNNNNNMYYINFRVRCAIPNEGD